MYVEVVKVVKPFYVYWGIIDKYDTTIEIIQLICGKNEFSIFVFIEWVFTIY